MEIDGSPPTIVVKISGSLMDDHGTPAAFWSSVQALRETGRVVVVHGGGQQMTALAERLGHTPTVVQGRRVTGDLDLDVALWAVCGKLNTRLVAQAQKAGLTAVGLTGADGALLSVSKRPPWSIDGETVDFGWVGDVEGVDTDLLGPLLAGGVVPVLAPLGMDAEGRVYNVNADTVASAVAEALAAERLLFVTATGGVRRAAGDPASHLDVCTANTFDTGVEGGWIEGGMRVKIETALGALRDGVAEAHICAPDDLLTRSHATEVVIG